MSRRNYILGSRSPQRLELLRQVVPADQIEVVPPRSADEVEFEDLHDWPAIEDRMLRIARSKCDDVLGQIDARQTASHDAATTPVITADTIIVATAAGGRLVVLGRPPEDDSWAETVRCWFRDYYAGRIHVAATALCVATLPGQRAFRLVESEVTFHGDVHRWLDWYISTGEPRGKAGGYAVQGAGSVFVSRVEGSISNVIGLPLRELLELFEELGIDAAS